MLTRLSQMNICHSEIHTVFGPSWEMAFMKDTVAFHHENVYSTAYGGIMTSIKKRKKKKARQDMGNICLYEHW